MTPFSRTATLKRLERIARTCYKSEDRITATSASTFVHGLVQRRHWAMLEHASISIRIICDRGVSHEIVRHRIASFAQESTRYVNYAKHGIELIHPRGLTLWQRKQRESLFRQMAALYNAEIAAGVTPQIARGILPTALKTEIVMTANLREWAHFISLRADRAAHPQMREIADMIWSQLQKRLPEVFGSITLFSSVNDTKAKA